jgi:hypothetical protein
VEFRDDRLGTDEYEAAAAPARLVVAEADGKAWEEEFRDNKMGMGCEHDAAAVPAHDVAVAAAAGKGWGEAWHYLSSIG